MFVAYTLFVVENNNNQSERVAVQIIVSESRSTILSVDQALKKAPASQFLSSTRKNENEKKTADGENFRYREKRISISSPFICCWAVCIVYVRGPLYVIASLKLIHNGRSVVAAPESFVIRPHCVAVN